MNLKYVVAYDGSGVRRYRTRFTYALSKKARAEKLQKKYPKSIWNRIRSLHRKASNITVYWYRKFMKEVALKAKRHSYAIVLEDLKHLCENAVKNGSSVVWKLSMFAYRKLQKAIMSKVIEYNVPIVFINPKNTSSTCPRCEAKLFYTHRLAMWICS